MSKLQAVRGVLKMFLQMAKEDFIEMDHKLIRITLGVVSFIIMALIWFYLFRSINPFRF